MVQIILDHYFYIILHFIIIIEISKNLVNGSRFYFNIELHYQQESLIQPHKILSFCINGIWEEFPQDTIHLIGRDSNWNLSKNSSKRVRTEGVEKYSVSWFYLSLYSRSYFCILRIGHIYTLSITYN